MSSIFAYNSVELLGVVWKYDDTSISESCFGLCAVLYVVLLYFFRFTMFRFLLNLCKMLD